MTFIKRTILPAILDHLSAREITLITGARQVGKTTLMNEIRKILQRSNQPTLYFNLDLESDFNYFQSQQRLLQKIRLELGGQRGFIFIDEIQRKENAGLFLKGLYDLNLPYKLIVSGSGSMELKEKIHESLTGRKRVFELSTITFREFVNYRTAYKYESTLGDFFDLEKDTTHLLMEEYLAYGGYPRIVLEPRKEEKFLLINEIYDSYLKRDIAFLLRIDRPELFTRLIQFLAQGCGSILNYSNLSADVGISLPTLKKYLWYAEHTFIIKRLSPYFRNMRKELRKSPVLYFSDLGLLNFAQHRFGQEPFPGQSGRLFQNFVFLILQDVLRFHFVTIQYWRTADGSEVDFIVRFGDRLVPFEVKFSRLKKDTISRGYRNFITTYRPERAYVINLDYQNEINIENTLIRFLPYYKLYEEEFVERLKIEN